MELPVEDNSVDPGDRMPASRAPNIRDVAKIAGVSYQTVSRVLNDSPNIRESTRDRVQAAIGQLGYRPNFAARALATSRSRTIGVLTAAVTTAQYGPATATTAIELAAREAGYRVSLTSSPFGDAASMRSSIDYLLHQSVEAIAVIAPQVRMYEVLEEFDVPVPLVSLAHGIPGHARSLSVDQVTGARLATRHLIGLGHEEILHLAGPQDWIEAEARMQGYLSGLAEADLRTRAPILGDWTASFGYYAGVELLRRPDFTAVFAGNDQMALGFLHACREMKVRVPEDVSVVGFDDIPEAAHFAPPLTTVRQDFAELGRRVIDLILAELKGDGHPEPTPIVPELKIRDSTGRPGR